MVNPLIVAGQSIGMTFNINSISLHTFVYVWNLHWKRENDSQGEKEQRQERWTGTGVTGARTHMFVMWTMCKRKNHVTIHEHATEMLRAVGAKSMCFDAHSVPQKACWNGRVENIGHEMWKINSIWFSLWKKNRKYTEYIPCWRMWTDATKTIHIAVAHRTFLLK